METNITTAPAQNHTRSHHHTNILSSTSTFIIIIPILIIIPLFSIFLIFVILRRIKFMNLKDCLFKAHKTIHINDSPDVRSGGCLYGGKSGGNSSSVGVPACKREGVQVLTYKEVEMATNKFSEANVIGERRFGHVVYRGVLSDGTVAAIKVLRREGKHSERAFRLEVDLLNRLSSPYLVKMLGYCADQHHRHLIFEFMPNGTLHHHLHPAHHHQPLNWPTRLRIALDCARALEFLHDHALPSIIHRDFNCSTILLDHNFRAKISHFGLAKTASDKINAHMLTRVLGTTGYMAPEYASTGKLTTKSDVYSYGVVLLELLTGRVPVDYKLPPGEHLLVSWALPRLTNREKLAQMVDPALQGRYSKKDLVQVAAIAAMCVQPEADYRPLMADVVQSLIPLVKNLSAVCTSNSFRYNQTVCLWS